MNPARQSFGEKGSARQQEACKTQGEARWRVAAPFLVIALLAASATVVWFLEPHAPTIVTYATPIGPRQQFELQDGTRLTLNTNSRVAVRIDDEHRDMEVLSGEVFFDVVHTRKRPLRVCAAGHLFTDLGTQFNARVTSSGTTVTVKYGEVEVGGRCKMGKTDEFSSAGAAKGGSGADLSAVMTSGEQVSIVDGAAGTSLVKRKLTRSQMENLLAWQDGLLIFDNTPLQEVLDQVNRYFPQHIEIADPALTQVRVSGMYLNSTMDSILRALEESHGIVALPEDAANPDVIRIGRIKAVAGSRSGSRERSQ